MTYNFAEIDGEPLGSPSIFVRLSPNLYTAIPPTKMVTSFFALADWRRTVAEMYGEVRRATPGQEREACTSFRAKRDALFRDHSQSPLEADQRGSFSSLAYFEYDPTWRVAARIDSGAPHETFTLELPEGLLRYSRIARIHFSAGGRAAELSLFWIEGYGGGLFLPFRDATSGTTTYGGGRYLLDTIKGADLGTQTGKLLLDFNFAYNPSCAYSPRWVCPLAPAENWLTFPVQAGEKMPAQSQG